MATGRLDKSITSRSNVQSGMAQGCFTGRIGVAGLRPVKTAGAFVLHWLATLRRLAHRQVAIFSLCCLFVAVVSVHDAALVVVNHEVISDVEQNPVGKWLIEAHGGEVWLFVFLKLAGTALVCAVLVTVYQYCRRLGMIAVVALSTFQMLLLCYLTIV
jgi:hypothetical protein